MDRYEWIDGIGRRFVMVDSLTMVNRFDPGAEVGASTVVPPEVVTEILRLAGEVDRLKGYEVWAGEAHTVFCHLLSLLNQGEWLPQGRQWPVVDKIRDIWHLWPDVHLP